jgi:hypothetical protein
VNTVARKLHQFARDPVLRRWILARLAGQESGSRGIERSYPPYLAGLSFASSAPRTGSPFIESPCTLPETRLVLHLAGARVECLPGCEASLFERTFADAESLLALHRFAWISEAAESLAESDYRAWVGAVWRAWMVRHGRPSDGWPWHPYTAAERLINVLAFAERHGLPAPSDETVAVLERHGPAIAAHLEYFGETQTGNHLANNGRALFLAGLALKLDDWAEIGGRILIREASRIFGASGVLREGSSHYHLLTTSWYVEAWRAAQRHHRAEAAALGEITQRALAVIPHLLLAGGLPLIGDVSPDLTPSATVKRIGSQVARVPAVEPDLLALDGWIRHDCGAWSSLMFVAPEGWLPLPGHGHEDCGSFELHHGTSPVIRDCGRRSYGSTGDGDVRPAAHNTLTIDGAGPYPTNKPYYSPAFRRTIAGSPPTLDRERDALVLRCAGFSRLGGVGMWQRTWRFNGNAVSIEDRVEGRGRHRIARYLHTTFPVERQASHLRMGTFRIEGDASAAIHPSAYWPTYGVEESATTLVFESVVQLPWSGQLIVNAP